MSLRCWNQVLRLRLVLMLGAAMTTVTGCGKTPVSPTGTVTPTPPTAVTPPPAPTPIPIPLPTPLPPLPNPPRMLPPTPAPPKGPAVHSTLNGPGARSNRDGVWTEMGPGGADRETFDDFSLSSTTTIRHIEWQGKRSPSRAPQMFYISFIADSNMDPVRQREESWRPLPLWAATFLLVDVNERLDVAEPCEHVPTATCAWYDYSVTLSTPFVANAGTRYWIMIQADSPPRLESDRTGWQWRKGIADNRRALTSLAGTTFPWDQAFALRP